MVFGAGGAFKVWLVEILTTVGSSLATQVGKGIRPPAVPFAGVQGGHGQDKKRQNGKTGLEKGAHRGPGTTRRGIAGAV